MPVPIQHKLIPVGGIHGLANRVYATEAERAADVSFAADDLYTCVYVVETTAFYLCIAISPVTWVPLNGANIASITLNNASQRLDIVFADGTTGTVSLAALYTTISDADAATLVSANAYTDSEIATLSSTVSALISAATATFTTPTAPITVSASATLLASGFRAVHLVGHATNAVVLTIPANTTEAIDVGFHCTALKYAAGAVTLLPEAGVTILGPDGTTYTNPTTIALSSLGQGAVLRKIAADYWSYEPIQTAGISWGAFSNGASPSVAPIAYKTGDIAIGDGANTSSNASAAINLAIGDGASISNTGSIQWGVAIGKSATVTNTQGTAVGSNSSAGYGGVALGRSSTASALQSIAIGVASATATNAIAAGDASVASATAAIAIGNTSQSVTASSVAIGDGAIANNNTGAVSIGHTAVGRGVTIGENSSTTNSNLNIAVGNGAVSTGTRSIAIGYSLTAAGSFSIAIGASSSANNSGTVVGDSAIATGQDSSAFGRGASATGSYAVAFGRGCTSAGTYTTALGYSSTVSASYTAAIAIGYSVAAQWAYQSRIGVAQDGVNAKANRGKSLTQIADDTTNATPITYNIAIPTAVKSCTFRAVFNAYEAATGDMFTETIEGCYDTANNAFIGSKTSSNAVASAGLAATACDITAVAAYTLGLQFTGEASKTLNWVCAIDIVTNGA